MIDVITSASAGMNGGVTVWIVVMAFIRPAVSVMHSAWRPQPVAEPLKVRSPTPTLQKPPNTVVSGGFAYRELTLAGLDRLGQLRCDLEQIADDAEVGDLEDR